MDKEPLPASNDVKVSMRLEGHWTADVTFSSSKESLVQWFERCVAAVKNLKGE